MEMVSAVLLGIIEGITEFLPISSTAHLILAGKLLGDIPSGSFEIIIQIGAVLAVLAVYISQWRRLVKVLPAIVVALIPTVLLGIFAYPIIKQYLLDNLWLIAGALIVGGVIMLIVDQPRDVSDDEESESDVVETSLSRAFGIGLLQSLAFIPGVSRAAATIIGGRALGLGRRASVEFSFFLSVPTIIMAAGYDVLQNTHMIAREELLFIGIGTLVSFAVALVVVRWLLRYIQTHSFAPFAWYRIGLGVVIISLLVLS